MGNVKLKRNQQIDLKLIALIKPHEMLYRRAKRGDDLEFRSKLWDKISATMNASFKLKRSEYSEVAFWVVLINENSNSTDKIQVQPNGEPDLDRSGRSTAM